MPEQYNKLAEGIVKGNVPMVASFVERYVSDDEPGFFVGDREHVEGDIRVHVTIFGYLEQDDTLQLGVVDLQQLPDGRVWMVVGALPTLEETAAWLSDVYSAMVRRMAARLVQFGFLDAPNRPRLRAPSSPFTLSQAHQALKPPRPAPAVAKPVQSAAPVPAPEPLRPEPQPAPQPVSESVAQPVPAPQPAPSRPAPSPTPLTPTPLMPTPLMPTPSLVASDMSGQPSGQRFDLLLTGAMVLIWTLACGMLVYLLTLLLR